MTGVWHPMSEAPADGVILLTVESADGTRKVFAATADFPEEGLVWRVAKGGAGAGFTRLHTAWRPVCWQHLPQSSRLRM